MSDPNAIDLQTWQDVVTAIEQALQMDGATVELHDGPQDYRDSMDVTLPNGKRVYVQITDREEETETPYRALPRAPLGRLTSVRVPVQTS